MASKAVKAAAKQIAKRNRLIPKRRSQQHVKMLTDVPAPKRRIRFEVANLPPGSIVLYKGRPMLLLQHNVTGSDSAELLFPDGPWSVPHSHLTQFVPDESSCES